MSMFWTIEAWFSLGTIDRLEGGHGTLDRFYFFYKHEHKLDVSMETWISTWIFSIFVVSIYGISLFSPKKFEEGVLEICFHLLRRSHGNTVNGAKMSDPIQISRTITKIVSIATVEVNLFQDLSPKFISITSNVSFIIAVNYNLIAFIKLVLYF